MAKKEHEKHTISPRSARLQRRVQAAVSACYMMLLTAQPAAAADTMWTRFSTNTYNADDYEIGDRFTAICTYGGSKSVSYVTGYTTTANYTGEVYRTGVTVIRYTVIFTGTPIASVDPEPVAKEEQPQAGAGWPVMTVLGLAALAAGAGGTYFVMKRKERMSYEETADDGRGGADAHHGDGHDGHGGRV